MENKAHALAAGIFVIVVAALVAGLGWWLMRDSTSYSRYELSTKDSISGLQPQAAVRYKGVAVGKVASIGFDPQTPGNVLIRIDVSPDAPVTPSTFAILGYQGVTGLAHIQLDDDQQPQVQLPPGPSGLPRLPLRPSPLTRLVEQGPAILARVEEIADRVNQMLSDDNQQRVTHAIDNIGKAAGGVHQLSVRLDATVAQRLDPVLASLPPLASDARKTLVSLQQAGNATRSAAQDIGQTARRLNAQGGPIDQLSQGTQALQHTLDQFGQNTLPRLNRATDEATRTARALSRAAGGLGDNPQALIYGSGPALPGPGEPGFAAPALSPAPPAPRSLWGAPQAAP